MSQSERTDTGGVALPPLPRVTRGVLTLLVVATVANLLLGGWSSAFHLVGWTALTGEDVFSGEVWRLVTYPWVSLGALEFVFSGLLIWSFLGQLEVEWGTRRTLVRVAWIVILPAVVVSLLGLVAPGVGSTYFTGPAALVVTVIVAFASVNPYRAIRFMFSPGPLSGDQLILLEGVLLTIWILFDRSILVHFIEVSAFGVALAWFRLEWDRFVNLNPRKTLLKWKKKRLQAKLAKLEKKGTLRVVRDDGDDKPKYLN